MSEEIHFKCPRCKCPMKGEPAILGETIECPDCHLKFKPDTNPPAEYLPAVANQAERTRTRAANIHNTADNFRALAIFFLLVGGVILLGALVASLSNSNSNSVWIAGGAFIGTAFWFYLVAQVIHIRANTEK